MIQSDTLQGIGNLTANRCVCSARSSQDLPRFPALPQLHCFQSFQHQQQQSSMEEISGRCEVVPQSSDRKTL
jgi:hypothetical protein